jgi:hypothetical protein
MKTSGREALLRRLEQEKIGLRGSTALPFL